VWIFGGQNDTGTGLFCWAKWHWSWFVLMGKMALVLVYFVGQNGTGAGLFCWAKWHWYWFILVGKMALVMVYFRQFVFSVPFHQFFILIHSSTTDAI